jgi:peptide/nickel transport system substrate-binding protein
MKRLCRLGSFLTLMFVMFVIFVITSHVGRAASQDKAELIFAAHYGIPTLDPGMTSSGTAHCVMMAAYDKLVKFKPGTAEIVPMLALDWDISEDLKTYTFHLRRGIKFTDGAPFNAEAVKVNIERVLALKRAPSKNLSAIKEVKVVDEYTVQFILKNPSTLLMTQLAADVGLNIISPKAIKEHTTKADPWAKDWLRNHMVGTGPYKLVEWIPKDRLILTKNEDYWRGWDGKHLDTIIRRTVPEWSTRKLLIMQGKADLIDYPPAEEAAALKATPGIKVVLLPSINVIYYSFYFGSEKMRNKKLRKALAYAFPYKEAVEIGGWGALQLQGPMPASIEGFNDKLFVYHTDLKKAAELLKEAGYKPGELTVSFFRSIRDRDRMITEAFQSNLQRIGVKMQVTEMAFAQYSPWRASENKEGADIFTCEHWANYPEATNFLSLLWENSEDQKQKFYSGYKNEDLNKVLAEARASIDPEKQKELYKKAQEIIVDDVPAMFGIQMGDGVVLRNHVKGFVPTQCYFAKHDFYLMYLEK